MAKSQSRGLGRGLDALLDSTPAPAPAPATDEPAKKEPVAEETKSVVRERVEVDPVEDISYTMKSAISAALSASAEEAVAEAASASAPAPEPEVPAEPETTTVASAEEAEDADVRLRPVAEVSAESIDVSFSLTDPEITERAPRPKRTAPAKEPKAEPKPAARAPQEPQTPASLDGALAEIALELIDPNPYQPRLRFDQEPLEELAASIARDGLLQPITVRPLLNGRFQIISGERRFRASQMAGLRAIPAYVREAPEKDMGKFALIENLQREDLNPMEAAIGYRNLMKSQHLTQSEVAQLVCKSRSAVANTVRLLDLPDDLQEMIYTNKLSEGHARAIQAVPTVEGRRKLAEKVVSEQLSVRATENLARFMSGRKPAEGEKTERATVPAAYKAVARSLKARLGANVKVKNSGGKNKIEIEFTDAEDLERIYTQIMGAEGESAEA